MSPKASIISGKTAGGSVWSLEGDIPTFAPLRESLKADVCVIGAGLTGLTCAYLLARDKKKVVVIDAGRIGGGETGRTTAHLTNAVDGGYRGVERFHGLGGARIAAQSHTAAIHKIETILSTEDIDCGFERVDGYLFPSPGLPSRTLNREWEAATRAGVPHLTRERAAPLGHFGGFPTGPALRFGMQAQFHPLKYLRGLALACRNAGVRIFERSRVTGVRGGNRARVTVSGGKVDCGAVIVATHTPFNDWVVIHTKQAAYRSYALAARLPRESVRRGLYWEETGSSADPYHYIRVLKGGRDWDLIVVGGEDHKTGQDDNASERHVRLASWAKKRFPMMRAPDFHWSGQVMESVDDLPYIGHNPSDHPNVFVATGFSGTGMTYATIAGMLLTDLICGRKNEWEKLYDPSRKTVGAVLNFARENGNVLFQYAHWFTAGQVASVDQISPGAGAVVRDGFEKLAVYRDENNLLYVRSATCPHLNGVVAWNSAEKSWDCPCHGSRFDPFGKVINGPACSDLPPANLPETQDESAGDNGDNKDRYTRERRRP
jgi:glycine/D-amino acid oxidase-like deaminating enzyme/nitrite reductase/ring-hydroxylating ferredoxin subunit